MNDLDDMNLGSRVDLELHVDGQKIASPYEGYSGLEHASDVHSYW